MPLPRPYRNISTAPLGSEENFSSSLQWFRHLHGQAPNPISSLFLCGHLESILRVGHCRRPLLLWDLESLSRRGYSFFWDGGRETSSLSHCYALRGFCLIWFCSLVGGCDSMLQILTEVISSPMKGLYLGLLPVLPETAHELWLVYLQ